MSNKITEEKRQFKRKENEKSSRFLDNYYNPNIHKKNWEPSGSIKEKNKYIYGDTGLAYNIKNYPIKDNDKQKNKEQIHFLEFDFLEENDIIIIIEHCSNCEKHINHTNHANDIFKYITRLLQICINYRFPFIKIYLKPIDTSNNKINRIGAFEIQLGMKINNKTNIYNLFSKLNTGQWPNFHNILNKISSYVPVFDFKFQIYDKEEGENSESTILESCINESKVNENSNNLNKNAKNEILKKPSKYENIKINLYSYNCEQIEHCCKEASNALEAIFNAKRKIELYYESNNTQNETINNNILLTKTSNFSNNNSNNVNNMNKSKNNRKGEIIEEISAINKIKGKILSTGYTDKFGFLYFKNVPFDSYVIEIESNQKFMGCGALIQFKKIYQSQKNNENYIFTKIFGLKRQIEAYLEVYLFSNDKKDNKYEINFVKGANVFLQKYGEQENEIEKKIKLKENIKGKYEIITTPGVGVIVVIQNEKEIANKEVSLNSGLNKLNIEINN